MEQSTNSILINTDHPGFLANRPMIPLNLLDDSEVKNDKCPTCRTSLHLTHSKGFRTCPYCGSLYKIWSGQSYEVMLNDNNEQKSLNEMMIQNVGLQQRYR